MRQQGDEQKKFRDLLNSFREGTVDVPEWDVIDSRALNRLPEEEKADFEKNALMLCSTNKDLKPFNIRKMREIGSPIGKFNNSYLPIVQELLLFILISSDQF